MAKRSLRNFNNKLREKIEILGDKIESKLHKGNTEFVSNTPNNANKSNRIEQAIEVAKTATTLDSQGKYSSSLTAYTKSIELMMEEVNSTSDQNVKSALQEQILKYVARIEELKQIVNSEQQKQQNSNELLPPSFSIVTTTTPETPFFRNPQPTVVNVEPLKQENFDLLQLPSVPMYTSESVSNKSDENQKIYPSFSSPLPGQEIPQLFPQPDNFVVPEPSFGNVVPSSPDFSGNSVEHWTKSPENQNNHSSAVKLNAPIIPPSAIIESQTNGNSNNNQIETSKVSTPVRKLSNPPRPTKEELSQAVRKLSAPPKPNYQLDLQPPSSQPELNSFPTQDLSKLPRNAPKFVLPPLPKKETDNLLKPSDFAKNHHQNVQHNQIQEQNLNQQQIPPQNVQPNRPNSFEQNSFPEIEEKKRKLQQRQQQLNLKKEIVQQKRETLKAKKMGIEEEFGNFS